MGSAEFIYIEKHFYQIALRAKLFNAVRADVILNIFSITSIETELNTNSQSTINLHAPQCSL